MSRYTLWRLRVPEESQDLLAAELWACGSLGIEVRDAEDPADVVLDAYFPDPLPAAATAFDLERWQRRGAGRLACEELADRDWLAGYRQGLAPIDLGDGFRVDLRLPGEGEVLPSLPEEGRRILRIPAQTAFGTGSHESTRLVVRWLEELDVAGLDVLDVGVGSGILSFVAELLGARRVVGFDRDAQAVCIARRNRRLNGRTVGLFAGRLAALRQRPAFDLALVNILPHHVVDELPLLTAVLRPGARVVSSGNLVGWRGELTAKFAAAGLEVVGEKRENDWVAFLLAAGGD